MKPIFDVPNVGRIAILTEARRRRCRLDDAGRLSDLVIAPILFTQP